MDGIVKIFKEPYPFEDDARVLIKTDLTISFFVVVFLYLFQPFGLRNLSSDIAHTLLIYSGYGMVTFIITILFDRLIRPAFPGFFNEQNWNVGRHILSLLVLVFLIGLGNLFYSHFLGFTGISGTTMLYFQFYTLLVAIFPITILTLISRMRFLKKNLEEVKSINDKLAYPLDLSREGSAELLFLSENERDTVRLTTDQFIYAESADNYSDIVYIESNIIRKVLLRSSLKRLMQQNDNSNLYSPHRSYIVNLRKVVRVEGNSQGYRLVLEGVDNTIPVSRRNNNQLKSLLGRLHGISSSR